MFRKKVKIHFFDCDPAGILFYANLFKLSHIAYEEMIDNFELRNNYFKDSKYAIPLIHVEGDYLLPIHLHETVEVVTTITQLKDSSFELSYEYFDEKNNLKARAKTVHIFVSAESFQKIKMPAEFYHKLETHLIK